MADEHDRPRSRQSDGDQPVELFPEVVDDEPRDGSPTGAGAPPLAIVRALEPVPDAERLPEPPPDQEIFIPIHKFVRLTEREVTVVDHPAFQRLGEVLQLGQTYLVYRGATHRRHEHALGTLHVAEIMIEALKRNAHARRAAQDEGAVWKRDEPLFASERAFARLGALLHDIGHLPAGHTFEDELGLFAKHDSMERLELVLHRRLWLDTDARSLAELVDEQYAAPMAETGYDAPPHELLLALIAHDYDGSRGEAALADRPSFRLSVCRDLIGNTICADLLDYLHRDWHHIGKHRQFDTRLIDYMEIRRRDTPAESKLVVYLRDRERVRHDAVSAILDLLESRYQLYEMGLYHRTKLAASAMLERAVSELAHLLGDDWLAQLPERLLDCSDAEMIGLLRANAEHAAERGRRDRRLRLEAVAEVLVALRQRRLHKKLYQRFRSQFTTPQVTAVQDQYASSADSVQQPRGGDRGTYATNEHALAT
jgi:HD superfamily phosphohydrolase